MYVSMRNKQCVVFLLDRLFGDTSWNILESLAALKYEWLLLTKWYRVVYNDSS